MTGPVEIRFSRESRFWQHAAEIIGALALGVALAASVVLR